MPTVDELPIITSGSGPGRHFYFFSPTALRSQMLSKGENREIELFGTGAQAVLPPSILPVTGQPHRWQRQIPTELVSLGTTPKVPIQLDARPAAEDDE